jgi:hypothetical protein
MNTPISIAVENTLPVSPPIEVKIIITGEFPGDGKN